MVERKSKQIDRGFSKTRNLRAVDSATSAQRNHLPLDNYYEFTTARRRRKRLAQNLKLPEQVSKPAFQAAERVVERVAQDGITESELAEAEKELTSTYGEKAAEALVWAAADNSSGLTRDGASWLQARNNKMGAQLANFQMMLRGHQQSEALLVDSNNDGQVDADDLALVPNSEGRFVAKQLGQALGDRVKVSAAVVHAAEALASVRARPRFPNGSNDSAANLNFWNNRNKEGDWTLVPGVRPSDAIKDIYVNGWMYTFDCATAIVVVLYRAILDLIGPEAFDAAVPDLTIGAYRFEEKLKAAFPWWQRYVAQSPYEEATPERRANLLPGDVTYFTNWDVSESGKEQGWSGENVIYLGNGRFYGHPRGLFTEEDIVKDLNIFRFKGSTRDASLSAKQARLDTSVLKWGPTDPSSGTK